MTTAFFERGWWRARRKYWYLTRTYMWAWWKFDKASQRHLLALERSAYSDAKQPEQEY